LSRVCISIATKGYIRAETVEWLLAEFVRLAPNVEVHIVCTRKPLMHARNEQVWRFLAGRCTHLFILDSDCLPQPDTIRRLLAYGKPIISAPHSCLINGERGLMVVDPAPNGKGYVQHYPLRGLQGPNVRVGCGGLLIAREVFETLEPPWFKFEYDRRGCLKKGEDFHFCEKALAAGYEIWAQCDLWQKHWCGEWI